MAKAKDMQTRNTQAKRKPIVKIAKTKKTARKAEELHNLPTSNNATDNIADNVICIEATEEIIETISELRRLEELKKRLLELEDSYRLKVTDFMGMHQQLKSGAFTLATWKNQNRRSFDASAFKTHFPDLYNSYQKEISLRVFRLC